MAKGLLQAAGVVSGFGNAIKEGLSDVMKYEMASSLDARRQEMDNLRQQRMLDAQRGMHRETIAMQREQGDKTREHQSGLAEKQMGTQIVLSTQADLRARELAGMEDKRVREVENERNKTTKEVHENDRDSQEYVAEITRDANVAIHNADRKLKKYEIDTSAESLTRTAASKAISEVGNEITRLNTLLANPMLDPAGPHAKNLVDRLKRLEGLHDSYSRYLKPAGAPEAPTAETPPAPFNLGKYAPKPPAGKVAPGAKEGLLNSPGIRVLPTPSEDVQAQYRSLLP